LTWGGKEKQAFFNEVRKIKGRLGPSADRVRPEIPRWLEAYWRGFLDLHGQRQLYEGGPQPLSFSDINAYSKLCLNLAPLQRRQFVRFTLALDKTFLQHYIDSQSKRASK